MTRKGLEKLLERAPEQFAGIVPQVIDQQTRLFSKVYFERKLLPSILAEADKENIPVSYLLLDLDKFHDFDREHGRHIGDAAISMFSELLRKKFRTEKKIVRTAPGYVTRKSEGLDYIGRTGLYAPQGRVGGGEEFAVILYGAKELEALNAGNRLLEETRNIIIHYNGQTLGITASGGIAQYQKGMTPQQLMSNAEVALKYSKENGRNRITVFSQLIKS